MFALLLCCAGLAAYAQPTAPLMRVRVPFDFQVGEKSLPAGEYVIKRDPQTPQFLYIQSPNRKVSARTSITAQSLPQQSIHASLIFELQGEKHLLAEVKDPLHSLAYSMTRSKEERKLAKARTIRAIPNDPQTKD